MNSEKNSTSFLKKRSKKLFVKKEFLLSLLPMPGAHRPGAWRGLRWAVLGVVTAAGFAVGALERAPPGPDPLLNVPFTSGMMFDVQ